jgi:hypothetical protein
MGDMFAELKKAIKFASTVLATLQSARTAYQGGSFAFIGLPISLILLFCLATKHYEGVFYFIAIA